MERDSLASIAELCALRWGLALGEPLVGGTRSYVATCTDGDGRSCVLKVSSQEFKPDLEAAVLLMVHKPTWASAHRYDPACGALLMDRVLPGTPMPASDAAALADLSAPILRDARTARVEGLSVPRVIDVLDDLGPCGWGFGALPEGPEEAAAIGWRLIELARECARELCRTCEHSVLLHGDFQPKNLLLGPFRIHRDRPSARDW